MPEENLENLLRLLGENTNLEDTLRELKEDSADSYVNKLNTFWQNLLSRLSESELSSKEFHNFTFEQLKSLGIFTETCSDNATTIYYMEGYISNYEPIKRINGLRGDYLALGSTPISDKAKEDISDFEKIITKVERYIRQAKDKKIFNVMFKDYVFSILPEDIGPRKHYILGLLEGKYRSQLT